MKFSINRSLCEIQFDKELKSIDVDVMEYVWFKIREKFLQNELLTSITIKFTELSKNIGKYQYQNKSLTNSINRLNGVVITTNIKKNENRKNFTFYFESYIKNDKQKGFTVSFNEKIYLLFDKPKSYNEYHQNYIYNLNTSYSKLFYKFIIGYKFLRQKSFYVYSDDLRKILNIKSDKSDSYIKSNFIDKSILEISKKTDIDISMEKVCDEIKDGDEIVKYKVIIKKFKGDEVGIDLKKRKRKGNEVIDFDKQIIDDWIEDKKKELDYDTELKEIPYIGLVYENKPSNYINDDYKLTDIFDIYTNTPSETVDKISEMLSDGWEVKIIYNSGFTSELSKVCLLSKTELKRRGKI